MDRKGIAFLAVCLAGMVGLKYVADFIWPTPTGARPVASAAASTNASSAKVNAPRRIPRNQPPRCQWGL